MQAPTPGDTSFIAALRARRPNANTNGASPTEKRRCFYCDGEGHIPDRCPTSIKDYLRQQTRMGNRQTPPPPQTLGKARHPLHRSTTAGPKKVKFAEAANTLPTVAESYGKQQVAALKGDMDSSGAVDESWGMTWYLTTYDEATVAALYDELQDEDEPDFLEGQ